MVTSLASPNAQQVPQDLSRSARQQLLLTAFTSLSLMTALHTNSQNSSGYISHCLILPPRVLACS